MSCYFTIIGDSRSNSLFWVSPNESFLVQMSAFLSFFILRLPNVESCYLRASFLLSRSCFFRFSHVCLCKYLNGDICIFCICLLETVMYTSPVFSYLYLHCMHAKYTYHWPFRFWLYETIINRDEIRFSFREHTQLFSGLFTSNSGYHVSIIIGWSACYAFLSRIAL